MKNEKQGFSPVLKPGEIVYFNFTCHPEFPEDYMEVQIMEVATANPETRRPSYIATAVSKKGLFNAGDSFKVGEGNLYRFDGSQMIPVNETARRKFAAIRDAVLAYTRSIIGQ